MMQTSVPVKIKQNADNASLFNSNKLYFQSISFQIAKFLGGESSPLILEQDPSGVFITSLEVDRIEADSGDTYGCQPNPGVAAEVKVHVIKEGN